MHGQTLNTDKIKVLISTSAISNSVRHTALESHVSAAQYNDM